jgi:hypothetical protein
MTDLEIARILSRADEACYDGEGINITKEDVTGLVDEILRLRQQLVGRPGTRCGRTTGHGQTCDLLEDHAGRCC